MCLVNVLINSCKSMKTLEVNPCRDQQLSGCVWTLMVARLSMSTNHQPHNSDKQPF